MDSIGWNALLFASKWVLMALVYLALGIVLISVRREIAQRAERDQVITPTAPGRLRVIGSAGETGPAVDAVFNLKPVTRLGADPENDLVLQDAYISRYHCRLRWDGIDWWVEDLSSQNGTYVNNEACQPGAPHRAPVGAILRAGGLTFELLE